MLKIGKDFRQHMRSIILFYTRFSKRRTGVYTANAEDYNEVNVS